MVVFSQVVNDLGRLRMHKNYNELEITKKVSLMIIPAYMLDILTHVAHRVAFVQMNHPLKNTKKQKLTTFNLST